MIAINFFGKNLPANPNKYTQNLAGTVQTCVVTSLAQKLYLQNEIFHFLSK